MLLFYRNVRMKRNIRPIPIENARPHQLATRMSVPTTTASSFGVSDIQDFAQMVELHDDEVSGPSQFFIHLVPNKQNKG